MTPKNLRSSDSYDLGLGGEPLFQQVLDRYFEGATDPETEHRL